MRLIFGKRLLVVTKLNLGSVISCQLACIANFYYLYTLVLQVRKGKIGRYAISLVQ